MSKTNLDYVSLLSKDSVVADGNITVPSHIKISGIVRMNVESAGKVVVTDTGLVEGYIRAAEIQISGKVSGDVIAAGKLVLNANGMVEGRIAAQQLSIEEGGICNSEIAVGQEAIARRKVEFEKEEVSEDKNQLGNGEKQSKELNTQGQEKVKTTGRTPDTKTGENGQQPASKSGKSPIDKEKAATKNKKADEDEELPGNKDWVDRFW